MLAAATDVFTHTHIAFTAACTGLISLGAAIWRFRGKRRWLDALADRVSSRFRTLPRATRAARDNAVGVTTDWWVAGPAIAVAVGSVASVSLALVQIGQDRQRRRDEARLSQARRISAWPGEETDGRQEVILLNRSDEPVYEAVVSFVFIQGAAWRAGEEIPPDLASSSQVTTGLIPPGRSRVWLPGDWHGMHLRPGVEVAFTDRAGIHWVRRANGDLHELLERPFDHYNVARPMNLVLPERAD